MWHFHPAASGALPREVCPVRGKPRGCTELQALGARGTEVLEVGMSQFECATMHIFTHTQQQHILSEGYSDLLSFPRGVSVRLLGQRLTPLYCCRAGVTETAGPFCLLRTAAKAIA